MAVLNLHQFNSTVFAVCVVHKVNCVQCSYCYTWKIYLRLSSNHGAEGLFRDVTAGDAHSGLVGPAVNHDGGGPRTHSSSDGVMRLTASYEQRKEINGYG